MKRKKYPCYDCLDAHPLGLCTCDKYVKYRWGNKKLKDKKNK